MAKRKRLSPANPALFGAADGSAPLTRAPIADVAREAATNSALEDVTQELQQARDTGRMVLRLTLTDIRLDHLVRDRVVADDEDMEILMSSLGERGQQTPIEVMDLDDGRYGLISGWRRCQALLRLTDDGAHDGTVLALKRAPSEASEAYLSMVEENEIRVGLSYFERARIAAKTVEQGVFETEKAALLTLFRAASRAKRSKIRSFLPLVAAFDGVLAFPHAIGERLGLRLSAALAAQPALAGVVQEAISTHHPETSDAEIALLTRLVGASEAASNQSLKAGTEPKQADMSGKPVAPVLEQQVRPQLKARWARDGDHLTLWGADMTPELRDRLFDWLARQR